MNINIQYHKHLIAILFIHFQSLSEVYIVQPCRFQNPYLLFLKFPVLPFATLIVRKRGLY